MRLLGAGVHLVLLLPFWAVGGEPLALLAAGLWVVGTALEGGLDGADGDVPRLEVARAALLLVTVGACLALAGPGSPVGLLVLALGLALRVWAARTLGAGFGAGLVPTVPLTSAGPYRYVAHPSELGLVLGACGLAVACGVTVALPAVLVGLPSAFRVGVEARALSAGAAAP
ncbi:MAG: hypothetical protein H6734_17245 [Alphaproteobacteria bacterium]|nr:hypothetical protein [Alphaproteobacteria bacterium]